MSAKTIEEIRTLLRNAKAIEGFHANYRAQYAPDTNCDKKGYGFGRDHRFAAFKLTVSFDSWAGYYGNSGCGPILRVDGDVAPYFIKAMNVHQELLLATAARLMREDAATKRSKAEAEIAAMQATLDALPAIDATITDR